MMTHGHDDHGQDDHGHDHDEHEAHDSATHGPTPLADVDPGDLHAAVDQLAAALHEYVGAAVGVRAEFGSTEADEDPRILALEARVGTLNATLYDLIHDRLGMHSDLTGMTWQEDEGDADEDALPEVGQSDTFHVGLVVLRTAAAGDRTLDSALDIVESGAGELTQALVDAGFDVAEWGVARGSHVVFGDDEHEDDA